MSVAFVLDETTGRPVLVTAKGRTSLSRWPEHRRPPSRPQRAYDDEDHEPTLRQLQIIALIAEGLTYREVGIGLGIGHETVKRHVKIAMQRLGCRSGPQLVHVAWLRGYLPAPERGVQVALSRLSTVLSATEPSA